MDRVLPESMQPLLSALSEAVGEEIALESDQECVLEFGEDIELVIAAAAQQELLSLRSPLTRVGQPLDAELLHAALALNYTHLPPGCDIALDDASNRLMLLALVDTKSTPPELFLDIVARFMDLVPALRQHVLALEANGGQHVLVSPGARA
jgi:hypothetical protein